MHAVASECKAVGDGADPLSASAFRGEGRSCAGSDHSPLVLRGPVDDRSQERVGRRVAVAFARRAHEAGARSRGGSLNLGRQHDVAGNAVTPGDDQHSGAAHTDRRKGRPERGPPLDWRDTADVAVDVPASNRDALAIRPSPDARTLRRRGEALLVGGSAKVGDGDSGMACGNRSHRLPSVGPPRGPSTAPPLAADSPETLPDGHAIGSRAAFCRGRAAAREPPWPLLVAALAPAYAPRRPTETVVYGLVRQHLESFLAHAREHYDRGLPAYVEQEFRAYLKCGVFSEGFTRCHCDTCGHDLLVAFSCHGRTICPSCTGRRMTARRSCLLLPWG